MYQALYRKWRPRTFDDVVGQGHITETLKRQVREGRLSHAYLFTGTRGTGKTSCAKILARAVNCEHPVDGNPCNECAACRGIEDGSVMDVLELDAASNNGVDQVRALRDEAVYSPASVRKRVYIVDEVHMLSTPAFNALLKILEEPPAHLMFILATTELHKVPATIKSRCQQFAFKRLSPLDITGRLTYVAQQEGIPLTAEGAALLSRLADGGMRDALSLLDQCATGAESAALGEAEILDALGLAGNVETAALMEDIANRDAGAALERLGGLYAAGKDVGSLLNELSALARDLLIRRTAPRGGAGLLNGGYDEATLRRLGEALPSPRLAQIMGQLQTTTAELGRSANRRIDAELCLIRLCDEALDDSPAGLSARLAKLETLAAGGGIAAAPGRSAPAPTKPREAQPAQADPPAGPDSQDDTPPWEEAPPVKKERRIPEEPRVESAPAQREAPPRPTPVEEDHFPPHGPKEETPARAVQAAPVTGDLWPELIQRLRGKVPVGQYTFLATPGMVRATARGGVLTLWIKDGLTKNMLGSPGIIPAVEQAGSALLGEPCRAVVTEGVPPEAQPKAQTPPPAGPEEEHDNLDDLLALSRQFGDIITTEE